MIKLFENKKTIHFTLIITFFFLLSFTGCRDEADQAKTGSVNLKISITNTKTPTKALINCNTTGISKINATIQNISGNELVSGGPWDCSAGKGTLSNVPVGNNYTVIVNGRSDAGTLIYQGTTQGISVSGESNTPVEVNLLTVDADNDGVDDAGDNCPNTPSNETVDANGCSPSQIDTDDDDDGIIDANDDCPNTQTGETVDANGCSELQKDDDRDGIIDVNDECPNTQTGETVDANGCSDFQNDADIINSLGMTFNIIESGKFMMGSPTSEAGRNSDETQYEVTLTKSFYIQTTEVTQVQWTDVMGANPSSFTCTDCPVEMVSWNDVQNFITAMNARGEGTYRLPTEAEWEYAARAERTTAYANGDLESDLALIGWYIENSESQIQSVAQKVPNDWGLYDMHGNASEWCQDWYGNYPSGNVTDPVGSSTDSYRVYRGGSVIRIATLCRSAYRSSSGPDTMGNRLGFRLVRTSDSDTDNDADNDGVLDVNDDCPNTPTGETVNENGCSDPQKDADGGCFLKSVMIPLSISLNSLK